MCRSEVTGERMDPCDKKPLLLVGVIRSKIYVGWPVPV